METIQYRHEHKYLLNDFQKMLLESRLQAMLRHDPHSKGYWIRSLYFDDCNSNGLFEKSAGVGVRGKFRIRAYDDSKDFIRLERKCRSAHLTRKMSRRLSFEEYSSVLRRDIDFLTQEPDFLSMDFVHRTRHVLLRPVVIVSYFRKAFVFPAGNVRVTFDSQLRAAWNVVDMFDPARVEVPVLDTGVSILEVKFDAYFPDFLRPLLAPAPGNAISVSKYVLCRKYIKQNDWEDA
ncbi:MAG TPA: polyphosphate polymerase domain-containing protein [Thermotogota bacterium]|nr:polyphosphate polymerase domain-containing protein [Thermotogota bacterium]HRW93337.1 polyphosphate polymerase domain-containing protein [Thermotogota bacterium]